MTASKTLCYSKWKRIKLLVLAKSLLNFNSLAGTLKPDILELFADFHRGGLDVKRLNYGVITLLPKVHDATKIQQFRSICLLNFLYKWITKTLTIRLENLVGKLILNSQSAFMKGRNIMNGILTLHEILHETKRRNEVGMILMLDFEKAYEKVNWDFLFSCLKLWGFCDTWCQWIRMVVSGGTMCVKLNNKEGTYFVSYKGVRQGDPLSPILFNFATDCLSRMVRQAQRNGLLCGLANNLISGGVVILQYADDTIICLKDNIDMARNMKLHL